jgi:TPR repeat protein
MYAEGRGTAKDPTAANAWIKAAQMAGDSRGDEMLRQIEKILSANQVTLARGHATKPQHADANLSAKNCRRCKRRAMYTIHRETNTIIP